MSREALADTKITLAQCNRCQSWIFLADSAGMRVAADPAPASREAYIKALAEGRRTFQLRERAGRPHKLLARTLKDPAPTWAPEGPQIGVQGRLGTYQVLVEHPCAVNARNAVRFTPAEAPKDQARASGPATTGEQAAGSHPPPVPASKAATLPHAGPVNPHPSDVTCDHCGKVIMENEEFWGFQHGSTWVYAAHA